jgi:hypothetical protein
LAFAATWTRGVGFWCLIIVKSQRFLTWSALRLRTRNELPSPDRQFRDLVKRLSEFSLTPFGL